MSIVLTLAGAVRVTCPTGDCTPRAAKARAALAVLGVQRGLRLSRARLQDLLWSDRGQEQGAASLRQVLSELRRVLGDERDALQTGPGWIGLDPARVRIVLPREDPEGFATDLDLRDPEFESWIRDERRAVGARTGAIAAVPGAEPEPGLGPWRLWIEADARNPIGAMVVADAAQRVDTFYPSVISTSSEPLNDGVDLVLRCRIVEMGDRIVVSPTLMSGDGIVQLWTRVVPVIRADLERGLGQVSDIFCSAILSHGVTSKISASGGTEKAGLSDLFAFCGERLGALDRRLARFDGSPLQTARVGALRAYLRYHMLIERCGSDAKSVAEEARALASCALEVASGNPVVLATAGLVHSQDGNHALAVDLGKQAMRLGSASAFVRSAYSASLAGAGRSEDALRAGNMSYFDPIDPGMSTYAARNAAIAVRLGREEEGLRHARFAHSVSSNCRPALRFAAALQFRAGDAIGARRSLQELRVLEPDFSLELMGDRHYPVASLRAAGFLDIVGSRDCAVN